MSVSCSKNLALLVDDGDGRSAAWSRRAQQVSTMGRVAVGEHEMQLRGWWMVERRERGLSKVK